MPTQQTTYNSRVTDEALEKKFRDTFKSQGGAELVDDLYAQGVIVPIVDFTAAATGQDLSQNLQTAWDFSTGYQNIGALSSVTLISNSGFWKIDTNGVIEASDGIAANAITIAISDGLTSKPVYEINFASMSITDTAVLSESHEFIVFLRSGDFLTASTGGLNQSWDVWYRQIADVSGNLTNPLGFTSS